MKYTRFLLFLILLGLIFVSCLSNSDRLSELADSTENTSLDNIVSDAEVEGISIMETPTIMAPSLPAYLGLVVPEPGTYSLGAFNEMAASLGWGADFSGICFSFIDPSPILEEGDTLTMEDMLARISVTVDGKVYEHFDTGYASDLLGWDEVDPETGQVIWAIPDGIPYELCYAVTLEPGYHLASINIERTSLPTKKYIWSFVIE